MMVITALQHNFHFIHNLRKFMEDGSDISYFMERRKAYKKQDRVLTTELHTLKHFAKLSR